MRNFKKISAIFVVIAMMLTMVSVNVFAAVDNATLTTKVTKTADGTTAITEAKSGSTVYVKYYLTAGTYSAAQIKGNIPGTVEQPAVVAATGGTVQVFDNGNGTSEVFVTWGSGITATDAPILTVPVTIPVGTVETNDYVLFSALDNCYNNPLPVQANVNATINVKAAWQIASDNVEDKHVAFGTADPALPTSIKVSKEATFADAGSETRTVAWTCEDYNATVPGDYTFTAEFTDTADDSLLGIVGAYVPTATVTVDPVAKTASDVQSIIDENTYTIMLAEGLTVEAVAASLPAEITLSVEVGEEVITDTVAVAWTAVAPGTVEVGAEYTATGTLSTPIPAIPGALAVDTVVATANGIFSITGDTVTTTVTVTPAEIRGSSISVAMKGYTHKPEVTVTLPADAISAPGTLNIYLTNGAPVGDEEPTMTYEITAEDVAANVGKSIQLTVKAPDYLKNLGFSVGDTVRVTANIDGAAILSGETTTEGEGESATEVETPEEFTVNTVISGSGSQAGGASATVTVKNYLIKVSEATNGTVAVSKDSAVKGTVISVTTTPAEGYKTEKITVKDSDGIDIPVDQAAKTFTMPGKDVTVSATFVEGEEVVAPVETTFADVTADHWAYEAIETLAAAGIINGNPDGTFAPDSAITRAEYTKMIVNLFGLEATSTETGFEDCAADDWFTPYVAAAKEAGYVTGVSDTTFEPNANITREQACAILGRALNATSETALTFTDADSVEAYAVPYVAALATLGVVNGYTDGSFAPANNITRAEAAKIIAGVVSIVEMVEDAADAPAEEVAEEAAEEVTEEATEEATEEVAEEATEEVAEEATEEAAEETAK